MLPEFCTLTYEGPGHVLHADGYVLPRGVPTEVPLRTAERLLDAEQIRVTAHEAEPAAGSGEGQQTNDQEEA